MINRFLKKPLEGEHSLIFLIGTLGVGKSSWCHFGARKGGFFSLKNRDLFLTLLANPKKIHKMIPEGSKEWIVVEEIQKIPGLLDEIFYLTEKGIRFILTASSLVSLKKRKSCPFIQKALFLKLFPLTVLELEEIFEIENSLRFGHLPKCYLEKTLEPINDYINTALHEEVLQKRLTKDIGAFSLFLKVLPSYLSEPINLSEIGRSIGIHRKVLEDYLVILEDLLFIQKIHIFEEECKRRLIAHPKIFFSDVGFYRALSLEDLFQKEKNDAVALETLIFQELRSLNFYLEMKFAISFWQTQSGLRISFILKNEKKLLAIAVKQSDKIVKKDLKALLSFKKDYPEAKLLLFYRGGESKVFNEVDIVPVNKALLQLSDILK